MLNAQSLVQVSPGALEGGSWSAISRIATPFSLSTVKVVLGEHDLAGYVRQSFRALPLVGGVAC